MHDTRQPGDGLYGGKGGTEELKVRNGLKRSPLLSSLCCPNLENVSRQIPLPKGEGGPKGRVRGAKTRFFTPHPPLRGTLSLRERNSSTIFPGGLIWKAQPSLSARQAIASLRIPKNPLTVA